MWVIYALKMPYRREKKTTTATTNKCLYGNDFSFWFRWKETENKCYLSIGHFCPDQQIEWYSNEFQLKQSHCVLRWVHRSITHRSSTFFSVHWTVCTCVCVESEQQQKTQTNNESHNDHTFIFISCRDSSILSTRAYVVVFFSKNPISPTNSKPDLTLASHRTIAIVVIYKCTIEI